MGERWKGRRGWGGSEVPAVCFSTFWGETPHTHKLCSGLLGPEEMSVCRLIHPPVLVLMMASTCCFNVTAGLPSILHWLWLPSAAGSSPLHNPPSISFIHPTSLPSSIFLLPLTSSISATPLLSRLLTDVSFPFRRDAPQRWFPYAAANSLFWVNRTRLFLVYFL